MFDELRSALTHDPLVFSVANTIKLFVPLDVRLESLTIAMAHWDSNFRTVLGHPQ